MTHAEPRAHLRTHAEIRQPGPCSVCDAASELIRAGDTLRDAERYGLNTAQHGYRKQNAELVWNAVKNAPHTCYGPAPRQLRRTP